MWALLLQIETAAPTGATAVDFTWLFVKMVLVLGIVTVGAILVLKYAVPHIGLTKRFQQGRFFTVLGRAHLEPRKSLYLVQVGKRYFVLGAAEHGINLVAELSEADVKDGA